MEISKLYTCIHILSKKRNVTCESLKSKIPIMKKFFALSISDVAFIMLIMLKC